MFFYAYESLNTPILRNAELLGNFADSVWHGKWQRSNSLDGEQKYKYLIFAGHSEGGVVIRRLVLNRYEATKDAIEKENSGASGDVMKSVVKTALGADYILASHLKLFAPACMGTNFSSWAGFLTSFSHLVSALTASMLVRNELISGSPILDSLKSGTEQAHADFPEMRSLYTRPIFGIPDQIVYTQSYKGETPLWDPGYDHFGVCKPSHMHLRPLEFVRK
jgi:hypothetical protein